VNPTHDTDLKPLKFFAGIIGLSSHIVLHHNKDSAKPGINVVLKCIKMRELSKEDLELIPADHKPKTKITIQIRGPADGTIIDKYLNIVPVVQESNAPEDAFAAEDGLKTKKRPATASPSDDRAGVVSQDRGFLTAGCD
jgi:hypothetical protein